MARAIGNASDFYRLRLQRVDAGDAPDFEWRDDILYRRPPETIVAEADVYVVEAVLLDDEDTTVGLARFDDRAQAADWMADAETQLLDMTRSEFEDAYFPADVL